MPELKDITTTEDVVQAWKDALEKFNDATDIIQSIPLRFMDFEKDGILFAKLADNIEALNKKMSDLPELVVGVNDSISNILSTIDTKEDTQYLSSEEAAEMDTDDPALEEGEDDGNRSE